MPSDAHLPRIELFITPAVMNCGGAGTVEADVALWLVSIGMGLAFIAVGAMKLLVSKEQLVQRGAGWVCDFSSGTVRFVAFTEMVGGLGMIVPVLLGSPAWLALTAAAAGLIVVVIGAAVIHARRREPVMIVWNSALMALAAMAVWGRSGQ